MRTELEKRFSIVTINFAMLSAFGHRGAAPALRRALDSRSGSARLLAVQAHISIKYVGGAGG